jgi:hypothetical protein
MMVFFSARVVVAASAAEINRDVNSALRKLYKKTPAAKELSKVAKGILVFPSIVKWGGLSSADNTARGRFAYTEKRPAITMLRHPPIVFRPVFSLLAVRFFP